MISQNANDLCYRNLKSVPCKNVKANSILSRNWFYVVICHAQPQSSWTLSLQWRHKQRDGVSKYQPHDCLLKRWFRHRSKKTSKFGVTGLCEGNSPVAGELPAQKASNAKNVSIWWRHHVLLPPRHQRGDSIIQWCRWKDSCLMKHNGGVGLDHGNNCHVEVLTIMAARYKRHFKSQRSR